MKRRKSKPETSLVRFLNERSRTLKLRHPELYAPVRWSELIGLDGFSPLYRK